MGEIEMRALLCDLGRRLWQRGLVGAAEGNLSVKLSPRRLLITPSGVSKGHLRPKDLVVIDLHGEVAGEGVPSSEWRLHARAYQGRPDVGAVIHAHPPYATTLAVCGETVPDGLMPEAMVVLGSVATLPFAMPSTDEVPDALEPLLADHKTFLMSHHGAVVLGRDLLDANGRMETLERMAQIVWLSRAFGGPQPMPEAALQHFQRVALHGRV